MSNDKTTSTDNYLDYIPVHSSCIAFETDVSGRVTILQENNKLFDRLLQILVNKPKVSQIHLDEMGSFIWPFMDGKNTVYSISQKVKLRFGSDAEPLYERLIKYIKILESYGFINLEKAEK